MFRVRTDLKTDREPQPILTYRNLGQSVGGEAKLLMLPPCRLASSWGLRQHQPLVMPTYHNLPEVAPAHRALLSVGPPTIFTAPSMAVTSPGSRVWSQSDRQEYSAITIDQTLDQSRWCVHSCRDTKSKWELSRVDINRDFLNKNQKSRFF